jgi:hypothetical protein
MDWKGFGRKRSWPNSRYYPGICLEGVRKTTKTSIRTARSPGRDFNRGTPHRKCWPLGHDVRSFLWHGSRAKTQTTGAKFVAMVITMYLRIHWCLVSIAARKGCSYHLVTQTYSCSKFIPRLADVRGTTCLPFHLTDTNLILVALEKDD